MRVSLQRKAKMWARSQSYPQTSSPALRSQAGDVRLQRAYANAGEQSHSSARSDLSVSQPVTSFIQHSLEQIALWPESTLVQRTPDNADEQQRLQEANAAVANRYPGGVEIAIALRPSRAEIQDGIPGVIASNPKISNFITRYQQKLGSTGRASLRTAFEALQAELADTGDRPTTTANAQLATEYDYYNDLEFERMASPHASANSAITLDNGELKEGRHTPFERTENPIEKVKNTSSLLASSAHGNATAPHNIRRLSIFTHGWHSGLQLGTFSRLRMGEGVANQLADYFGSNVNVMLYACSAASQDDSFAETLASTLASNGVTDVRVFGHTTSAHTTRNPQGREFVAHREGENVTTTGRTNQETIFDATFLDAEDKEFMSSSAQIPCPPMLLPNKRLRLLWTE